jgi:hypothetical protein
MGLDKASEFACHFVSEDALDVVLFHVRRTESCILQTPHTSGKFETHFTGLTLLNDLLRRPSRLIYT